MKLQKIIIIYLVFISGQACYALKPGQILVIANSDYVQSVELAEYYCQKRAVPRGNIIKLKLGKELYDQISRKHYNKYIVKPLRKKLTSRQFEGKIRCLLTTYCVPIKVGGRGALKGKQKELEELRKTIEEEKKKFEQLEKSTSDNLSEAKKVSNKRVKQLQEKIDDINGKETNASVDSELSMVLFKGYNLYRWQPNNLQKDMLNLGPETMMVARLDGPGFEIAKRLVDKAIAAEKKGLTGICYFDSRGLKSKRTTYSPGYFDQSIRDLALLTRFRTNMVVKEERTGMLFPPHSCPQTAIYCGWYSLKNYIDSFEFVDGAIGYHIASWEAVNLRDLNSSQWCPSMLKKGVTATIGAVAEPYLHSFPFPKEFFLELYNGECLVEAYYHTKPFNSWQLILVGDPLYTPFNKQPNHTP